MPKYAYQYGKRWNVRVPRFAIDRMMARLHVSTSPEVIEEMIRERIAASPDRDKFTVAIMRQCFLFAHMSHGANVKLYYRVMRGF